MPEVETVTSSESCNIHCSNLTFHTTAILLLQDPLFFPKKIQLQYSLELPLRWPTDQLTAQLLIAIQDSETPFFYQPSSIHKSNPLINTFPKTSPPPIQTLNALSPSNLSNSLLAFSASTKIISLILPFSSSFSPRHKNLAENGTGL